MWLYVAPKILLAMANAASCTCCPFETRCLKDDNRTTRNMVTVALSARLMAYG